MDQLRIGCVKPSVEAGETLRDRSTRRIERSGSDTLSGSSTNGSGYRLK